jgi:hypothetical protein
VTDWPAWRETKDAPDYISRCLCVEDMTFNCIWHFGEHIEGQWFDLPSGNEINATHWLPLPPTPTHDSPTEYAENCGIGNAPTQSTREDGLAQAPVSNQ